MPLNHHSHPPLPPRPEDEKHLRWLVKGHWILAGGIAALWLLAFVLPLSLGPGYFQWWHMPVPVDKKALEFQLLKGLFILGGQIAVVGLNGWLLKQRKNWLSCAILSCVECITLPPFGLALGVCAVLVLRRESVQGLFKQMK